MARDPQKIQQELDEARRKTRELEAEMVQAQAQQGGGNGPRKPRSSMNTPATE